MKNAPKMLIWHEPTAIRRKYYPMRGLARWFWRLLGVGVFCAFLAVVLVFPNPDPNAKWVALSIGVVIGGLLAFLLPVVLSFWGSMIAIGDAAIERHDGPLPLLAFIHGLHVWRWPGVTKLRLTHEEISGTPQRILWVLDAHEHALGCVGLSAHVSDDTLAEWAHYKACSFERE